MTSPLLPNYNRADIAFDRGEGPYLFDSKGERYLDFGSGVAVSALGHAHPHIVAALQEQAGKLWHTSNLYRIPGQERLAQRLVDASFADRAFFANSGVALVGRSMRKNFNIASNLGMASAPDGVFINPKEIENYPDDRVIAISTGSQGEPLSALRRMAFNDHRDVELHSGDTIIFSATAVPGNERAVNDARQITEM